MRVYGRESTEILKRFRQRRISFDECIAALGAAFAGILPPPEGEERKVLQALARATHNAVMKEMERRERQSEPAEAARPN